MGSKTLSANIAKKKNGHKISCECVICKNIKAKDMRGGYDDDRKKLEQESKYGKKINGHKIDCKCHICKAMNAKSLKNRNAKKKANNSTKKITNNHKNKCKCPICNSMRKTKKQL